MLVLQIIGLIGLLMFIVFGILWILSTRNRVANGLVALSGAILWAITTVIATLIALF